ncbi:MAG: acyltransferase domain-containing protein [Anaerolineae bacterium]|nr:acyltransferase domain-containing protein [Anaerolineae bacterium]
MNSQNTGLSPIKQALLEIRELRTKLNEAEQVKTEPIAVIGMGIRFPGETNTPEAFWQLLRDGVDAIITTPLDRWDPDTYYASDSDTPGKMSTRGGGFLSDVSRFDPHFFGISPREAISMDPQQRMLLEVSWEALEHAGQAPDKLNRTQTGVFIGISGNDYFRHVFPDPTNTELYPITGNAFSVAAGRLAYTLGLQGPCMAVDTACSSSLTAIHLACQSLRAKESKLALVGGVNLMLSPEITLNFAKSQMMAADDHCKTFDAEADGYVRGEGCGVVVLKRLSDALANGDNILALIRGSAINQDGRSSGLTAPNGPAQEAVIRQALVNAGVEPNAISYVETHGTGTPLGDPIEVQALVSALAESRTDSNKLLIGSVKTNVGHLEAAAGIAGLLKVVLALQHQEIPPHLNFNKPSPYIPWEQIPVKVVTERTPWVVTNNQSRVAGVSSFGFSGTNAHIILEEFTQSEPKSSTESVERPLHLLKLSARRPAALTQLAANLEDYLETASADFRNVCFTANVGRSHLPYRLAIAAASSAQAREKLIAFKAGQELPGMVSGQVSSSDAPEVAFLFTGHGAQYVNMGRRLYETQPVFRQAMDQCDELLQPYLDRSLVSILYPSDDVDTDLMDRMTYAQPALFALEYSLATLWQSWGVKPIMVLGHSLGEYVAACIAGVFNLADGLKLVATRGRLMDSLPQNGEMAAIFASEAEVASAIASYGGQVSIAAINGPESIVISGTTEGVQTIADSFEAKEIKVRRLAIPQAAHSPLLEPILDAFEQVAKEVTYAAPEIGLVSALSGQLALEKEITTPGYWRRHLREPVQFAAAIETMRQQGQHLFVEIGPHPVLLGMSRRCFPDEGEFGLWLPSLRRDRDDWEEMLEGLATLYVQGLNINWRDFERNYPHRHFVPLPTYPWAKEHYWFEEKPAAPSLDASALWNTVLAAGRRQAAQGPLDLGLNSYPAKWDCLDRLTTGHIIDALQTLGLFTQSGETHTLDTLMEQGNILPTYQGLLTRWVQRLVALDLLQHHGDKFSCQELLPDPSLDALWIEADQLLSDIAPIRDYVKHCSTMLTAVLTGAESPLETLFPGGAYTTTNYLYHYWPIIQYYNGIVRANVEAVFKTLPPGKALRILEIGAGTGGTSAALLPYLPPHQTHYYYTDVSEFFLDRAKEKFQAYSFIQYGLLNIENAPEPQGYNLNSFDIVIAANALHATRDLNETLNHVHSLLVPGGLVLLLEGIEHLSWLDISTGLIEGWSRFEDGLRHDDPLLPTSQWLAAFQTNGFEQAVAFPEDASISEILKHNILMAQTPSSGTGLGTTLASMPQAQGDSGSEDDLVTDSPAQKLKAELAVALPDERHELLIEYIRSHVANVLKLNSSHPLGRRERLMDLGLDSLMAVELRSRLGMGLELKGRLPATLIFDYPTIEAIAGYLEAEWFAQDETDNNTVVEDQPQETLASSADVEDLSDEEVEALLLKKLQEI